MTTSHMLVRDGQPIAFNSTKEGLVVLARAAAQGQNPEATPVESGSVDDDTFTVVVPGAGVDGADITYAVLPKPEGWTDPVEAEDAESTNDEPANA